MTDRTKRSWCWQLMVTCILTYLPFFSSLSLRPAALPLCFFSLLPLFLPPSSLSPSFLSFSLLPLSLSLSLSPPLSPSLLPPSSLLPSSLPLSLSPSLSLPDPPGLCRHRAHHDRQALQTGGRHRVVMEEPEHCMCTACVHVASYYLP